MDLVIAIFFGLNQKKELYFFWVLFPDFNISAVFNADYLLQDTHADLLAIFGIRITGTCTLESSRETNTCSNRDNDN